MVRKMISDWLSRISMASFVILILLVCILWCVVFNVVIAASGIDVGYISEAPDINQVFEYFSGIVIIPMLESLLFQKLPYWGLTKISYMRRNMWLIYIISAALFALSHIYSIAYIIYTFIIGLILIYSYHIRINKHPFWTITLIHSLFNASFAIYKVLN